MIKKDYQKPTMKIVLLQHQSHLLTGSVQSLSSNLDDELYYDGSGSNGSGR